MMIILAIVLIAICALLSLANYFFGKMEENRGIIGDIANIVRWIVRKWWLWLIIIFILMVLGIVKI